MLAEELVRLSRLGKKPIRRVTTTLSCFISPLTRTYVLATIGAAIRDPRSIKIKACDGPPIASGANGRPCGAAKSKPDGHPKTNDKGLWPPCIKSFLCYLANVEVLAYVLCRVK